MGSDWSILKKIIMLSDLWFLKNHYGYSVKNISMRKVEAGSPVKRLLQYFR